MKKILRVFFDLYIRDNKLLFSICVRIYYYAGYFFYSFNIFLKKPYIGSYLFSDQESGRERQKIILNKIVKKIKIKKIKILEIGVYCGQTTSNITNTIKEKNFEYTCVDIWKGFKFTDKNNDFQHKQMVYDLSSGRVYKLFLHNIKCIKNNFTGGGRIIIKKTSSQSFFKNNKKKFDLIIIDASHKFKNAYEDIKSAKKILNNLGYIIGDDYELEGKNFTFHELKKFRNTDLTLSKKFNKTFHPGITLAVKYLFKNLKNNKGLFCVRKVGNRYYDYFESKYKKIPTSFQNRHFRQ